MFDYITPFDPEVKYYCYDDDDDGDESGGAGTDGESAGEAAGEAAAAAAGAEGAGTGEGGTDDGSSAGAAAQGESNDTSVSNSIGEEAGEAAAAAAEAAAAAAEAADTAAAEAEEEIENADFLYESEQISQDAFAASQADNSFLGGIFGQNTSIAEGIEAAVAAISQEPGDPSNAIAETDPSNTIAEDALAQAAINKAGKEEATINESFDAAALGAAGFTQSETALNTLNDELAFQDSFLGFLASFFAGPASLSSNNTTNEFTTEFNNLSQSPALGLALSFLSPAAGIALSIFNKATEPDPGPVTTPGLGQSVTPNSFAAAFSGVTDVVNNVNATIDSVEDEAFNVLDNALNGSLSNLENSVTEAISNTVNSFNASNEAASNAPDTDDVEDTDDTGGDDSDSDNTIRPIIVTPPAVNTFNPEGTPNPEVVPVVVATTTEEEINNIISQLQTIEDTYETASIATLLDHPPAEELLFTLQSILGKKLIVTEIDGELTFTVTNSGHEEITDPYLNAINFATDQNLKGFITPSGEKYYGLESR
tara:strand:- start:4397 stop:6013 length:1617 start_codon:yes stop_codon:yes gene_type:complete